MERRHPSLSPFSHHHHCTSSTSSGCSLSSCPSSSGADHCTYSHNNSSDGDEEERISSFTSSSHTHPAIKSNPTATDATKELHSPPLATAAHPSSSVDTPALHRRRQKRTCCVIIFFLLLLLTGLGVFIVWPRTPLIRIDGVAARLSAPSLIQVQHHTLFTTTWQVATTWDSRFNYVPLRVWTETVVKDALTGVVIGHQHNNNNHSDDDDDADTRDAWYTIPPSGLVRIDVPVKIDYQAAREDDVTLMDLKSGCFHNASIQLQFWITLHIAVLDWFAYRPSLVAIPARGGLACPT